MSRKKNIIPDYESVTPFLKGQASKIFKEVADNDKVLIIQKQNKPQNPYHPIFCCTPDKTVMRQLNLSWGVYPLYIPEAKTTDELLDMAVKAVMQTGALKDGDLAVVTSGAPLNSSNSTNMLRVYHIGETI